jgi:S1-C subfamily serine protease
VRNASWLLWICVVGAGCSASPTAIDPESTLDRAVSVSTTACGHASKTSGAGVIIEDGRVLASAHVVIGAGTLSVGGVTAEILKIDTQADLALLGVPGVTSQPVEFANASPGEHLTIIGGGRTQSLDAIVVRPVEVRIEEVRSTQRSSRLGYELDTRVALGDSGAGAFNSDGRLVGIVFGRFQTEGGRSFIVRSEEVIDFLGSGTEASYQCDPQSHRVVPVEE